MYPEYTVPTAQTIDWTIDCDCGASFVVPEGDRPEEAFQIKRARCPYCGALWSVEFDAEGDLSCNSVDPDEEGAQE